MPEESPLRPAPDHPEPNDPSQTAPGPPSSREDAERLERLYAEHSRAVYRAAHRVTGSASDAERLRPVARVNDARSISICCARPPSSMPPMAR